MWVSDWPSRKLPFECQKIAKNLTYFQKICQNFSFFFKKLPMAIFWKKWIILAIFLKKMSSFWHSNCNFPEGQVRTQEMSSNSQRQLENVVAIGVCVFCLWNDLRWWIFQDYFFFFEHHGSLGILYTFALKSNVNISFLKLI